MPTLCRRSLIATAAPRGLPLPDVHSDQPLLLVYTSGTTGVPKGALHTQAALLHQLMRHIRLVAPASPVAAKLAANCTGCTLQHQGNGSDAETGFVQGVDAISFVQVQAACGHGQLHLAVRLLRLNRLNPFTTAGVALRS